MSYIRQNKSRSAHERQLQKVKKHRLARRRRTDVLTTEDTTPGDSMSNWIEFKTAFNQKYVNALKIHISDKYRKWNKQEKVWLIHPDYASTVKQLVQRYYTVDGASGLDYCQAQEVLRVYGSAPQDVIKLVADYLIDQATAEDEKRRIGAARELILKLGDPGGKIVVGL